MHLSGKVRHVHVVAPLIYQLAALSVHARAVTGSLRAGASPGRRPRECGRRWFLVGLAFEAYGELLAVSCAVMMVGLEKAPPEDSGGAFVVAVVSEFANHRARNVEYRVFHLPTPSPA
ncbi:hypothetical protein [Cryobacterium sp. Y62]|uniref:hypothetical protein n=1 Tax=Cryobacterium sp. Y62 TaxID=2048284 RepID=UPI0011B078FC|nr:hypothetical protein [Cryobacterium sp. Y62]